MVVVAAERPLDLLLVRIVCVQRSEIDSLAPADFRQHVEGALNGLRHLLREGHVTVAVAGGRVLLIQIGEASIREWTARAAAVAVVVDAGGEPRIPYACEQAIEFRC